MVFCERTFARTSTSDNRGRAGKEDPCVRATLLYDFEQGPGSNVIVASELSFRTVDASCEMDNYARLEFFQYLDRFVFLFCQVTIGACHAERLDPRSFA